MIVESILSGRRRSSQQSTASIASVSIEILPEFGWSIGNERLFGPGTLFQGHVVVRCKEHSARATRLRMHFQGVEAMLTYDVGPGIIRTNSNQLFGVRHTLWKKLDDDDGLDAMTTYKFLFTIQMPFVQFPPSMHHDYYRCTYKLSAFLDPSLGYGEVPVMSQRCINYIPLTETRLLKTPLYLKDLKSKRKQVPSSNMPSVTVKLNSVEYLSGDTVQAAICPQFTGSNSSSCNVYDYHVTMNLYQISTFSADSVPILSQLVDTQSHHIEVQDSNKNNEFRVALKLKEDLPPSFEYSKIMTLAYKLKVKVYIKKRRTSFSLTVTQNKPAEGSRKLKEMMTNLPWPSTAMSTFETDIVVGTLSRGVRAGEDLQEYTSFRTSQVPSPKFIKHIEYEDELPRYESTRLPSYTSEIAHQQHCTTGSIISGTSLEGIRSSL
ncbi:hypothetical protein HMPREF1544_10605 [Mucor circinelloides 1006PhL]|uniref:Arrestin C-terminal-like domain-containing protein n=1 Tax=Mucor circinelloides f. circinelloides (strain 1006PhL) TaxID=1220926 RepID=S2IZD6_MUCC1|nr:hypothetical protein HMPREF1544_10605 [Mucor circinelloides 1006PhL]